MKKNKIKLKKDIGNSIVIVDITEINRTIHPNTAQYTLFSSVIGTFTKVECMIGYEIFLHKI